MITLLRGGIGRNQLFRDMTAGIVVGIVALPLAIAFAIASGVTPEKGLITAIIAGFIISALGGSRVQIGGPTGAFIVIVFQIVSEHGVAGLTLATFMAGLMLVIMGISNLGNLLKYIPYPLIVGFTSGIAVIIFTSQIKDFLGLPLDELPPNFLAKWKVYLQNLSGINWTSVLIAGGTVIISLKFHKLTSKLPGTLVAIVLATLSVSMFHLPVSTIASAFGNIPNQIPSPTIPVIALDSIHSLLQPALAIALLGGIESLLSAVVADGMIGGRHRPNAELVAQGIANCASSLFGGIPATGAIARTATNIKNGGRTPVAGIVHSVVLLLTMLLLAPYAKLIPMACLSGILIVVAYHMSEWRQFRLLLKAGRNDVMVLLTTFILTIVFDLILAIEVGVVLSSFLLMKRLSDSFVIQVTDNDALGVSEGREQLFEDELPATPKGVTFFEISGPLFFGAAQAFQDTISLISSRPKVVILRMRHVPFMDATGIHRLKEIIIQFKAQHIAVILSGVNGQVKDDLEKHKILELLDRANIKSTISDAMDRANELMNN